jgi:hypothetical protein
MSLFSSLPTPPSLARTGCNAFEIQTQSPFAAYYNAMVRKYGRSSPQLKEALKTLAKGLGNEELKRTDDKAVDCLVTVTSACLFQLVSKLNHSCSPNCEVVSKCFKETSVDLVATKEIPRGGELNISYLNLGRGAGARMGRKINRRAELRERYLFECQCARCEAEP